MVYHKLVKFLLLIVVQLVIANPALALSGCVWRGGYVDVLLEPSDEQGHVYTIVSEALIESYESVEDGKTNKAFPGDTPGTVIFLSLHPCWRSGGMQGKLTLKMSNNEVAVILESKKKGRLSLSLSDRNRGDPSPKIGESKNSKKKKRKQSNSELRKSKITINGQSYHLNSKGRLVSE